MLPTVTFSRGLHFADIAKAALELGMKSADVFKDPGKREHWYSTGNKKLKGRSPNELISQLRYQEVLDALNKEEQEDQNLLPLAIW